MEGDGGCPRFALMGWRSKFDEEGGAPYVHRISWCFEVNRCSDMMYGSDVLGGEEKGV